MRQAARPCFNSAPNLATPRAWRVVYGLAGIGRCPLGQTQRARVSLRRLRIAVAILGTVGVGAFCASTPAAASARITEAQATRAFDQWLSNRYHGNAHGYRTCPAAQIFGTEAICMAEVQVGLKWHSIHAVPTLSGGRIDMKYVYDTAYVLKWSKYSSRIIGGFQTPGVASVNGPAYDWAWLAAGAYYQWVQHKRTFVAGSYDGNAAGFGKLEDFRCQAGGTVVRCTNALGDSMTYLPNGLPPSGEPLSGWTPHDLWAAYGLTSAAQFNGAGSTVAIVVAYKDSRLDHDLATYRNKYLLPPCRARTGCLRVLNEYGRSSPLPKTSAANRLEIIPNFEVPWAAEQSLDIDMVSAACPLCRIVVIEANSTSQSDLLRAEDTAASVRGVKVVSNSWGFSAEFANEAQQEGHFTHPGVAFVASAGDKGYGAQFPAALPNVISVGGTQLARLHGSYSETAWNNSAGATGGGCGQLPAPPWQGALAASLGNPCNGRRMANDVSAIADNLSVYDTADSLFPLPGLGIGWIPPLSGTSASAPFIAGVIALAADGGSPISPAAIYAAPASAFHDVTSGTNGDCSATIMCFADTGYDGPTGLGTPNGLGAFRAQR